MSSVFKADSTPDGNVEVTYQFIYARLGDIEMMQRVDANTR